MTRPRSNTVDYFPHMARHGSTMAIIEGKFGNDGYSFWFKLLELISISDNHFLDFKIPERWEYLQVFTKCDNEKCEKILKTLAKLDAIDRELWECDRVVWATNFVENIKNVYKSVRKREPPSKPPKMINSIDNPEHGEINSTDNPEHGGIISSVYPQREVEYSKVEYSKVKESKKNIVHRPENLDAARFCEFWTQYPRKENRKNAETSFYRLKLSDDDFSNLISGLGRQKMCDQWTRDNGKYIPHPTTWLIGRRWEDVGIKIDPLSGLNPTQRAVMEHRRRRLENGEQITD